MMCDGVDVFWLESFFGVCANLFLCEYLRAPLCDQVCSLVVEVFVVLYFDDIVWGDYCFTRGHICISCVCGLLCLDLSSCYACVCGYGFVCGWFSDW